MKRIAVVKVRGNIGMARTLRDTLRMIGLTRTNHCALVDDRITYLGMIQKAKDLITWGEINQENVAHMLIKRAKLTDAAVAKKTKYKTVNDFAKAYIGFEAELVDVGVSHVFRLSPPRRGYEGTKKDYKKLGSLGNRKEAINDLLERMI